MRYNQLSDIAVISNVGAMVAALARWVATVRDMNPNQVMKVLENKTVSDINLFHGQQIAALTRADFFQGAVTVGITNMDNFVRPTNEYALITAIRIKAAVNAVLNTTVWLNGLSSFSEQNGTFTFRVNGVTQLDRYPLFASVDAAEDIDQGVIQLKKPIIIGDQEPFVIQVVLPVAAQANFDLLFELIGIGTIA